MREQHEFVSCSTGSTSSGCLGQGRVLSASGSVVSCPGSSPSLPVQEIAGSQSRSYKDNLVAERCFGYQRAVAEKMTTVSCCMHEVRPDLGVNEPRDTN